MIVKIHTATESSSPVNYYTMRFPIALHIIALALLSLQPFYYEESNFCPNHITHMKSKSLAGKDIKLLWATSVQCISVNPSPTYLIFLLSIVQSSGLVRLTFDNVVVPLSVTISKL